MKKEIESLINNLKKKNMAGFYVEDKSEMISLLKKLIPKGSMVGCGDSVSLEQTGVFEFLRKGDYRFNDKHVPGLSAADKRELYIKNFSADTFITGTNAITKKGEIFNIDGNGSRVAPMIYGPGQVVIVIGKNKIVKDVDSAIKRARQTAAPLDAKRLKKNTPCVKAGRCVDCSHKQRICNDFVLITGQFTEGRIKVIIVNEKLGY